MKIKCESCSAEHDLDPPSWVLSSGRPFRFRCSSCGHSQMVDPPTALELPADSPLQPKGTSRQTTAPIAERRSSKSGSGKKKDRAVYLKQNDKVYLVNDWATLQRWIMERRVGRDDQVSEGGVKWSMVGSRAELGSFFAAVEQLEAAELSSSQRSDLPEAPHASAGLSRLDDQTEGVPLGLPPLPTEDLEAPDEAVDSDYPDVPPSRLADEPDPEGRGSGVPVLEALHPKPTLDEAEVSDEEINRAILSEDPDDLPTPEEPQTLLDPSLTEEDPLLDLEFSAPDQELLQEDPQPLISPSLPPPTFTTDPEAAEGAVSEGALASQPVETHQTPRPSPLSRRAERRQSRPQDEIEIVADPTETDVTADQPFDEDFFTSESTDEAAPTETFYPSQGASDQPNDDDGEALIVTRRGAPPALWLASIVVLLILILLVVWGWSSGRFTPTKPASTTELQGPTTREILPPPEDLLVDEEENERAQPDADPGETREPLDIDGEALREDEEQEGEAEEESEGDAADPDDADDGAEGDPPAPVASPPPAPKPTQPKPAAPKPQPNLSEQGWKALDAGDPNKALDLFRRASQQASGGAKAHFGLGYTLLQLGRTDEGITALCTALGTSPGSLEPEIRAVLRSSDGSCD
ncbi:MAG: hypothetical protein EA397_18375 [Deltaproteobacteria bacterium]|nr:MAG: hypothetical protein EA397_18375 [Deltaproteobacteria bacterium]